MKRFFTLSLLIAFQFSFAQINPLFSPYNQPGDYTVIAESDNSNSPTVYTFRPTNLQETYPVFMFQLGANPLFGSGSIDFSTYDIYLEHLASYGYIVIVVDDSNAGFPNGSSFNSIYDWYISKLNDPNHWMSEIADPDNVVVGGHSLGGVNATAFLENNKNDIHGIVYFASFPSQGVIGIGSHDIGDYTGKVLSIAGAEDTQSTPAECYEGFESFNNAACKYWVLLDSVAHGGFGDYTNPDQPVGTMEREKVTASIRHYLVSFMESAFKGDSLAAFYLNVQQEQPYNIAEFETNCLYIKGNQNACIEDTVHYEIGFDNGVSYCWDVSGGTMVGNNNNSIEVLWNAAGQGNIQLAECDNNSYNGQMNVEIDTFPDATFSFESENGFFEFESAGVTGFQYNWNFGNGQTALDPFPQVQYTDTGVYTVTLQVNSALCVSTFSQDIVSDICPVASFNSTSVSLGVEIENTSQFFNTVFWDFGGGLTTTEITPDLDLASDTLYDVTLIVSNDFCSDTITQTINTGSCAVADFSYSINGLNLSCTNESLDNSINFWYVNGINLSQSENFNYTFSDTGIYTVSLIVFDDFGCKDGIGKVINVNGELTNAPSIEYENDLLKIYPNPADHYLRVKFDLKAHPDFSMKIYDFSGKLVYQSAVFKNKISLKNFENGIYMIELSDGKNTHTRKFVKH